MDPFLTKSNTGWVFINNPSKKEDPILPNVPTYAGSGASMVSSYRGNESSLPSWRERENPIPSQNSYAESTFIGDKPSKVSSFDRSNLSSTGEIKKSFQLPPLTFGSSITTPEYSKTSITQSPRETLVSVSEWLRERYSALHIEQQLTERYEFVISQKDAEIQRLLTVIQVGSMWSTERIRVLEQSLQQKEASSKQFEIQNSLNNKKEHLRLIEIVQSKGEVVKELELLVVAKDKEFSAYKEKWEKIHEQRKQEILELENRIDELNTRLKLYQRLLSSSTKEKM